MTDTESMTTATLTFEPGADEVIREIVRDEIKRMFGEKVQGVTKAIFTGLVKTVAAQSHAMPPTVVNNVHAEPPRGGEA